MLGHNCLDKCLDETRDQDTTFETKTIKAVTLKTIIDSENTVPRRDSVSRLPITGSDTFDSPSRQSRSRVLCPGVPKGIYIGLRLGRIYPGLQKAVGTME